MNKNHIVIVIFISLFTAFFLLFPAITRKNNDNIAPISAEPSVRIGDSVFNITVADTLNERTKGLSGREKLSFNEGLVFVFEKPGIYPFWMKDMNFPIDIIWIGEDFRIVYIKENATPESYPKTFTPDALSLYVFEVNAGTVAREKIKIGDEVFLDIFDGEQLSSKAIFSN